MPSFFIGRKLFWLKILLICAIGLANSYENGYHPSAEEYDKFLRESTRTWTRDLHAAARRRSWTERNSRNSFGFFVPRFNYEPPRKRFGPEGQSWPGHVLKLDRIRNEFNNNNNNNQNNNNNDQQGAGSSSNVLVGNQIGSTLGFTMFSDEGTEHTVMSPEKPPQSYPSHQISLPDVDMGGSVFSSIPKPEFATSGTTASATPFASDAAPVSTHQSENSVMEIASTSNEQADNFPFSQPPINDTDAHFPIFFTNPATGIVYAITEVGKMPNKTQANDSIPIYITKEQYDRDMYLLKKYYQTKCSAGQSAPMRNTKSTQKPNYVITTPSRLPQPVSTTTAVPQVVRIHKPFSSDYNTHSVSLHSSPHPLKKPSIIKLDEVTTTKRPTRKKKKKKSKRKKPTVSKLPSQVVVSATYRPAVVAGATTTARPTTPYIIWGTRAPSAQPSVSTHKLTTQLEKPNVAATIFNDRPLVSTAGFVSPISKRKTSIVVADNSGSPQSYANHRFKRSAVMQQTTGAVEFKVIKENATRVAQIANVKKNANVGLIPLKGNPNSIRRPSRRSPPKRPKLPPNPNTNRRKINRIHDAVLLGSAHKNNTKQSESSQDISSLKLNSGNLIPLNKEEKVENDSSNQRKRKKSKGRKDKNEPGFSLFDLIDSDSEDDDDDDYNDDYNDSYYNYEEPPVRKSSPKRNNTKKTTIKDPSPPTNSSDSIDDVKEETVQSNSSSAEEGADFGALEEEITPSIDASIDEEDLSFNTKNTDSKKRIRRRPPGSYSSGSLEDYDSGDDDDYFSGVGGFFRMIFYPVQVIMTRIFDNMAGGDKEKDEVDNKPKYPTYTLYNNVLKPHETDEDDSQPNSLGGWLSSWFGFNRRTKKIGSTTAAPQPAPPEPLEEPSWLESWFGYGKATTEASYEDYYDDDYNKWFFGWFDSKSKARRRTTSTTTTTTSPVYPHVPILTVVDPMRNPQNWIGILAHHIVNSTASSHQNPIIEAITRVTTTTENPDVPRKVFYDKFQIWRLKPLDENQVKVLEDFKRGEEGAKLHWLKGPSLRGLTDVLVPPKMLIDFQGTLDFEGIAHEVMIFDVGKAIDYEKSKEQYYYSTTHRPNKKHPNSPNQVLSWYKYHEFDDIVKYLEAIRMRFPHIIELIHIGRSYEGRPLIVVKIESKEVQTSASLAAAHKKLKHKRKSGQGNAVFIEAGIHGLEWIGPATATWIINEVLRIMKSNKTNTDYDFVKDTTWYILPVLNPDGYVYSHEFDRFWKKSRSRHISKPSGLLNSAMTWLQQKKTTEKVCYGVDLDRNWHYQWGKRGSSKMPCNENFVGPQPFSEPETKALSDFLMDYRKHIRLYLSMQSYGQIISYPIRANASFNSERLDDYHDVAMVGTDGLRKKGSKSRYKIDSSNDLLENRSGCSDAFAAYEVGIPFSYTIQLADNGVHGYLLPSQSIEGTARDAFEIITSMLDYI